MQITTLEVIKRALRLCGQTGAPGRGIAPEQQAEVMNFQNQMFDGWNALSSSIYATKIDRYALTPSQLSYTIGPTGDFVAPRPIRINNANIVLTNTSPEVHLELAILDADQWAEISVKQIPTQIPIGIYDDYASPNSNLYLWGYPTQDNDLELFTWQGLSSSLTDADTLELPDGYARAVVFCLAVEIAPLYWQRTNKELEDVRTIARKSYAALVSMNAKAPKQISDAAFIQSGPPRPYFNYFYGW